MNPIRAATFSLVMLAMAAGQTSAAPAGASCQPTTIILMHAQAESAEVKVAGKTLFSGRLELVEPALGISAQGKSCIKRGRVLVETVQDGAVRSQPVTVGHRTKFIYIDMGRNPRVDASDTPFLLD